MHFILFLIVKFPTWTLEAGCVKSGRLLRHCALFQITAPPSDFTDQKLCAFSVSFKSESLDSFLSPASEIAKPSNKDALLGDDQGAISYAL